MTDTTDAELVIFVAVAVFTVVVVIAAMILEGRES